MSVFSGEVERGQLELELGCEMNLKVALRYAHISGECTESHSFESVGGRELDRPLEEGPATALPRRRRPSGTATSPTSRSEAVVSTHEV
jgi:hypothetical protein